MSTRPGSHHSIPESVTAITVDGRPVLTCHAWSTEPPWTPQSSWGLSSSVLLPVRAEVSFQFPPPLSQLEGRTGGVAAGVWSYAAKFLGFETPEGLGGHGNVPFGVEGSPAVGVSGSVGVAGHEAGR